MSLHVHVLDIVRTGSFGGIQMGVTRAQVQVALGEPPEWSVRRRRRSWQHAAIWKYGSMEFYFEDPDDSLQMIFSDDFPLEGSATFLLDPWVLEAALPPPQAQKHFEAAGLAYTLSTDLRFGITYPACQAGVILGFDAPVDRLPGQDAVPILTTFWLRLAL